MQSRLCNLGYAGRQAGKQAGMQAGKQAGRQAGRRASRYLGTLGAVFGGRLDQNWGPGAGTPGNATARKYVRTPP